MGYTHYFSNNRSFTDAEWEALQLSARRIFRVSQDNLGIALSEEYDINKIPVINDEEIAFNGYGDEGYETFAIRRLGSCSDFCKTGRKPYDAPVVALLIEATRISDGFSWSSDGKDEPELEVDARKILDHEEFEGIA